MSKRKINEALMLAAGENALLQAKEKVSQAKPLYNFTKGKDSLKLELHTIELHHEEKEDIITTIEIILKNYF